MLSEPSASIGTSATASLERQRLMTVDCPVDVIVSAMALTLFNSTHPVMGPSAEIALSAMLSVILPPPAPDPAIVQTRTLRIYGPKMPAPVLDDRGRPT